VEQQNEKPVSEVLAVPVVAAPAPAVASPALGGFAAALGNRAFAATVARSPRVVPARAVLARDPDPQADPSAVTATERQTGLVHSLIGLPLAGAEGDLGRSPSKPVLRSIRRRVAAARGAFRSFRFPPTSVPGQRMRSAEARVDIVLALLDGMLSNRPDRLLRGHWGKTLTLCHGLSRRLPKPTTAEPEDKRSMMRDSVCPAVAAAIADIPLIVGAESGEETLQRGMAHDQVPTAIFDVAGDQGIPAAIEFKKGLELIKLMSRPEEERAAFVAAHVNRAWQDLMRINQDMSEDGDLAEPGDEVPEPAPAVPPDPAPSPNPLPPPPPPPPGSAGSAAPDAPPPDAPSDAGVPPAAGVPG
jgi:hypothetical protein